MMTRFDGFVWMFLFFVFCEQVSANEPLFMKYEPGIDREIVRVVGVNDKYQELIVIEKSFLSRRKAAIDPKRSEYETYIVVDAAKNKTLPFLTANIDEAVSFGGVASVPDGYIIPVIREQRQIELYKYNRRKGKIHKFGGKVLPKQIDNLNTVHATTNGYVTVTAKRDSLVVKYYSYNDGTEQILSLLPSNDAVVSITDIVELNNVIHFVGTGLSDDRGRYLLVASVSSVKSGNATLAYRRSIDAGQLMSAKFVRSHQDTLSIILSERQSSFSPPVLRLIQLGDKPVQVWEEATSNTQGDKDYSVAWLCGNKFVTAKKRRSKSKQSYLQGLEFSVRVAEGKATHLPIGIEFENTVLKDISLYPSSDSLFSISNFSKVEKTKRLGGWFSWYGYRVDKIDIRSECVR